MIESVKLGRYDAISSCPTDSIKRAFWFQQNEVCDFLSEEILDERIIIYASCDHSYIISAFVPKFTINKALKQEFPQWHYDPSSGWGTSYSWKDVNVCPPFDNSIPKILRGGQNILFLRSYEGLRDNEHYFELNQRLAHVLQIHFLEERKAWCKINEDGDVDEVVKILEVPKGRIVLMKVEAIKEYAGLENLTLLRMFDFTRFERGNFHGWPSVRNEVEFGDGKTIIGKFAHYVGIGSYSRGIQIANLRKSKNAIHRDMMHPKKKYASFVIQDVKNRRIREVSCNPDALSNYFQKSAKPFEISPVFFKPEVLLKYKSNREKYQLESRSISCRGAWSLKTYDINSASQVHTYIGYLNALPYNEQLHWKQFNEEPKDVISKRAYATDILGQWSTDNDPLDELKRELQQFETSNPEVWSSKSSNSYSKLHYPVTESMDEWADEILNLDQLLVEGFNKTGCVKLVQKLGIDIDPKYRELKLLEMHLIGKGFENDHAVSIIKPFRDAHNLRSVLKGHSNGSESSRIKKEALAKYGTFANHFRNLISECVESLKTLRTQIEKSGK